jgi:membrane associated rhomboid family serine protease
MQLLSRYNPGNYSEEQYLTEKRVVRHALFVSVSLVMLLWVIKLFEAEYSLDFSAFGILPLKAEGLRGIIFSPLIHSGFEHLAANSIPLLILTFSLFFFYRKSPYTIFILIYLLSGCFVWLFGREALHIGASGVIYGLAAFLFLSGIISYNVRLLTISLIVALVYGYLFWGIFPVKPEISWESHLWGGVSGFGLALLYRKSIIADRVQEEDGDGDVGNDNERNEEEGVEPEPPRNQDTN